MHCVSLVCETNPYSKLLGPPRFRYGWAALAIAALCASAAANVALLRRVRAAETKYAEAVTVQMIATDAAAGAAGRLVPSLDGRHGTLSVQGLPGLPPGSQYQLWLVGDSGRTSGGVFSVDGAGCGVLRVSSPAELRAYTAFGVTVEPAGGSPGPTGPRVLGGRR